MYTLKSLLERQPIVIPILQRDYAQGRNDAHATRVRHDIVRQLKRATLEHQPVDFDFIYGTVRQNRLHPLDGQQRLTTLFLLYWYIGAYRIRQLPTYLFHFSYETRVSARDFFDAIRTQKMTTLEGLSLSEVIQTQKWFHEEWLYDPTVQGALVMLDAIHEVFADVADAALPDLQTIEPNVTFQFLDLDQFHLDESLYIKMNSRGKPLTSFEHFKAQFEQMLEKREWIEERNEFAHKMEVDWSDLLWPYRNKQTQTIDDAFLNVYRFISSVLFFRTGMSFDGEQKDFFQTLTQPDVFEKVYSDRAAVHFLFQTLNIWQTSDALESDFRQYTAAIPLIRSNIVERLVQGSLSNDEPFLVYMVIRLKREPRTDGIEYIRVVRNLLEGIRQNNQGVYNSNLRFDMFEDIYKQIDQFLQGDASLVERLQRLATPFNRRVIDHEIEKQDWIEQCGQRQQLIHRLEDNKILRGLTHRVFPSVVTHGTPAVDVILEVLEASPALVSRAMLAIEDYALIVGNSNQGYRYVFGGNKFKGFVWTNQMEKATAEDEKQLQFVIDALITKLVRDNGAMGNRLKRVIAEYANAEQDWRYYFTQYENILTDQGHIFIFPDEDGLQIERLNGVNLQGAHSNPIYLEVARHVTNVKASVEYYGTLSRLEFDEHECNQRMKDSGEWEIIGPDVPIGWEDVVVETEGDQIQKGIALAKWVSEVATHHKTDERAM